MGEVGGPNGNLRNVSDVVERLRVPHELVPAQVPPSSGIEYLLDGVAPRGMRSMRVRHGSRCDETDEVGKPYRHLSPPPGSPALLEMSGAWRASGGALYNITPIGSAFVGVAFLVVGWHQSDCLCLQRVHRCSEEVVDVGLADSAVSWADMLEAFRRPMWKRANQGRRFEFLYSWDTRAVPDEQASPFVRGGARVEENLHPYHCAGDEVGDHEVVDNVGAACRAGGRVYRSAIHTGPV